MREIFYTFNASAPPPDPTVNSTRYTTPLIYPVGGGFYKAIAREEDVVTAVTSKSFERDWTPEYITTALWLDANDLTTITKDGSNLVSQWNDKSGNGKNATATGTERPLYNTSAINFTLTEAMLGTAISCSEYTMYIIQNIDTAYSSTCVPVYNGTSSSNGFGFWHQNSSNYGTFHGGIAVGQSGITPVKGVDVILGMQKTKIYINGSIYTVATNSFNNPTGNYIIGQTSVDNFKGKIREIILLTSTADATLRQKIEGYLAWKWDAINGNTDLVTALPSDHPYKLTAPIT